MFEDLKSKFFSTSSKGGEDKEKNKDEVINNYKKSGEKGHGSNAITNLIIVFLVGVLLVIVGTMFGGTKGSSSNNNSNGALAVASDNSSTPIEDSTSMYSAVDKAYKENLEEELVSILEEIQGVGKVKAVINFENGVERVPVFNEDVSKSETSETDTSGGQRNILQENGGSNVVMESNEGNQQPFISKSYNPTISGILIVAEGATDRATELRVRQAAVKLFGLEDEKVVVYPMKK